MARRVPLSAASKRYELIATISPEISAGEIETCRDPRCYSASILTTDDMSELNGWDGGFIAPDEVVWASRWSHCRHVYRIDRDVLPEIQEQSLDGWVGPRKGRTDGRHGDRLELRWVPPVYVNGDGEAVAVVHKTR